nr:MAG: hypothetical protein [Apis mellifera filamentous virus]
MSSNRRRNVGRSREQINEGWDAQLSTELGQLVFESVDQVENVCVVAQSDQLVLRGGGHGSTSASGRLLLGNVDLQTVDIDGTARTLAKSYSESGRRRRHHTLRRAIYSYSFSRSSRTDRHCGCGTPETEKRNISKEPITVNHG